MANPESFLARSRLNTDHGLAEGAAEGDTAGAAEAETAENAEGEAKP